ncbi:MAG: DNA cytosine methyltransferase [Clostridia bacterium]|nr:DNA cytosine methyltransferase [Clostridia bacterium]
MRVLVACEESQEVCKAFRARGHEAYSCDIQDCSGGHPEWHIKADALELIKLKWDLIIAHPPCTYLTSCGAQHLFNSAHQVKDQARYEKMMQAKAFFLKFYNAGCERIAIENPAPMHIAGLPPYSQIIQPYMFGDPYKKRTCLWLKGLPPLFATELVEPLGCWVNTGKCYTGRSTNRTKLYSPGFTGHRSAKLRSKTFTGIARAMAEQWG